MMKKIVNSKPVSNLCPHLGLLDDPGTAFAYPNLANYCFHCQKPRVPTLAHQGAVCMVETHMECPVYLQSVESSFPVELAFVESDQRRKSGFPVWGRFVLGLGLLLVGVIIWLAWGALPSQGRSQTSGTDAGLIISATPSLKPPKISVTSPPPSATSIPPTATLGPTVTLTLRPPQIHTLDEPIKVNGQSFVLHRVAEGEQLALLSKRYQTSLEVMQAINYLPPAPVWVGRVLVLAPGLLEVPSILPLDPYQVTEAASLEDLAVSLGADPQLMLTYNGCNPGCELVPGDWVLVPRAWPTPTP